MTVKKKKNYTAFLVLSVVIIVIVLSQEMLPYTSIGFLNKIKTPFELKFQKQVFEMYVGETLNLRVNRINVRVKYSSSDFKLAYVNTSGKVTALKPGTVIIYGKIGSDTISCKIKIKAKK